MKSNKKHIEFSFFLDLFFNAKTFPPFYKKITNSFLRKVVYERHNDVELKSDTKTYSISDIPSYFLSEFIQAETNFKLLTTPLYSGYLINLTKFNNLEDYLDNKLGKPRKSQLKRYRKRLDICLSPEYKIFYGAISKDEYNTIFNQLLILTERRFAQKEELNFELPYLEFYKDMMYPLILEKKACIFVIYDGIKPINIALNFIDDDTVFHWNSCYDIDYQMFNLGHINMVNHLEWAFKNNFKLFDMGRGDFLHKRKYVNESYMYEEHIIYNPKSLSASFFAHSKLLKLKARYTLIQFLKKTNVHLWYNSYVKYKYRMVNSRNRTPINFKIDIDKTISKIPNIETLTLIDLNKKEYDYLIKPLNYFLYKSQEHIKNINVYGDLNKQQTFYFKGLKNHQKIIITN